MCSIYLYEAQAACIITCIRCELALLVMVVAVLIVYWCTAVSSGGGQWCPVGVDSAGGPGHSLHCMPEAQYMHVVCVGISAVIGCGHSHSPKGVWLVDT